MFIEKLFQDHQDTVMIDTGCTSRMGGIICNSDLLVDIRVVKRPLMLAMNAGKNTLTLEGQIPRIDKWMWYNPEGIENVISFSALIELGHRIKFNSDVANEFIVYLKEGPTKFNVLPSGLYGYTPKKVYFNNI